MYLSMLSLCKGFPSERLAEDLASFYEMHRTIWQAFPKKPDTPGRIMFRHEQRQRIVLVQSEKKPDWTPLMQLRGYLECPPVVKPYRVQFAQGQRIAFRFAANPDRCTKDPTTGRKRREGLFEEEDCLKWLDRQGERCGFKVLDVVLTVSPKILKCYKPKRVSYVHAQFDGILVVTGPDRLALAVESGIGAAKSFGAGMLSVTPA